MGFLLSRPLNPSPNLQRLVPLDAVRFAQLVNGSAMPLGNFGQCLVGEYYGIINFLPSNVLLLVFSSYFCSVKQSLCQSINDFKD